MGDIPTTFTGWVSFLVERFGAQFAKGTVTTLEIAFLGTLFGCLLGFLVGIVQSLTVDQHSSPLMRVLVKGLKATSTNQEFLIRSAKKAQQSGDYFG